MTEPRSNLPRRGEMSPSLGPPSDGFDYLLQVRWESRRCEQTKAVDVPKEHEAAAPTQQLREQPLFDLRLPAFVDLSPEWIEHFLGSFQRLRQRVDYFHRLPTRKRVTLPSHNDIVAWKAVVFNAVSFPTLSFVTSINEVMIRRLVQLYADWLSELAEPFGSEVRCVWLFSLLSRLDTPLHDDTAAAIRAILRLCVKSRKKCSIDEVIDMEEEEEAQEDEEEEGQVVDDNEDINDDDDEDDDVADDGYDDRQDAQAMRIDMLATICRFFGQAEHH